MSKKPLKSPRTRLHAGAVATLVALAASLLLAPGVAHAYEVRISISGAGQVTETTQADLVGSDCVTTSNNPTGTLGKFCFPGDPNGDYGWGWDVDYLATPKPGYRFVQWQSDGSTQQPIICDRSSPQATTSTYTGTACKFRTFDNLQTRAVFVDDTKPTLTSLTGPNRVVSGQADFTFAAQSDPTFHRFECRVAGVHEWQTCSSGRSENPAQSGSYTFQVRAVDWSGNLSSELSWDWTVDKTLPQTTLDSGVGPDPDSVVQDTSAQFEFSTNESGSFECRLDKGSTTGSWSSCGSPKTYSDLSDGRYTFNVRAKDDAGNVDDTPATRTWTVRNPPTVVDTSTSLEPDKGATAVPRDTDVSATFSEAMAPLSLAASDNTSKTFKLQQYNKNKKKWKTIPATISLSPDGKTATLDPYGATEPTGTDTLLAANKKFRAMITTGAKDAEGNPMTKQFVWTFTTGAT